MYSITIENEAEFRREWRRAEDAIGDGTVKGVDLGCKEGAAEALRARTWKDKTGEAARKTRGYLEFSVHGGAVGVIECAVPYASYLDSGTKPHEIWARKALMLRWYDSGGTPVFAKMVHHPGTRGDGFMGKAYHQAERTVIREVEIGVAKAQHILDD